jgi:glycosyltransferase involved in cell wall biosynthesis
MVKVACIVVDNGDPHLLNTVQSLLRQTRRCDEIVVAPGPKTGAEVLEQLKRLGAKVLDPVEGIGKARVKAILSTDADIIVSCDSDTLYHERYVEEAVKTLVKGYKAVKAGAVEPHKWSLGALLELPLATLLPYEFGLAFWRTEFLKTSAVRVAQETSNRLWDIGPIVAREMQPIAVNPRMRLRTRLPTHAVKHLIEAWTAPAIAAAAPIAVAATVSAMHLTKALDLSFIKRIRVSLQR